MRYQECARVSQNDPSTASARETKRSPQLRLSVTNAGCMVSWEDGWNTAHRHHVNDVSGYSA